MSQDFVVRNGLIVNNFVLYANSSTGRVGVNNSSPDASLTVTGTANVSGNVTAGDHLKFGSGLSVNSTTLLINNTNLSNASLELGNSTINSTVNSTILRIIGGGTNTTANATHLGTGTGTFTTAVNVGANVSLSTTTLNVGNATVNLSMNSTSISFNPNSTTSFVVNTTTAAININSSDAALKVMQRGTGNSFVVEDASPDASPFVIDGAGRVIIGANVNYIYGTGFSASPLFQQHGNTTASSSRLFSTWGFTAIDYLIYSGNANTGDKDTAPTLPPTTTALYQKIGRVHTDVDTVVQNYRLQFQVDGTGNTTTTPTAMNFIAQNATSTTLASRLFLAANGNLGLGTTSPTDALHAVGNVFATVGIKAGANVSLTTTTFSMGNATSNLLANSITLKIENASGNTTINSSAFVASGSVNVGANVSLSTSRLFVGNSTVNLLANSILLAMEDATTKVNVSPTSIRMGAAGAPPSDEIYLNIANNRIHVGNTSTNAVINSTVLSLSRGVYVGVAGVLAPTSETQIGNNAIHVGNSSLSSTINSTSRPLVLLSRTVIAANVASIEQTIVNTDWDHLMVLFSQVSGTAASTLNIALANSTANIVTITADNQTLAARSMSAKSEIFTKSRSHYMTFQGVTESSAGVANTVGFSGSGIIKQAVSVDVSTATKIVVAFTSGELDAGTVSFYGIRAG
jgi:hypothetical protein